MRANKDNFKPAIKSIKLRDQLITVCKVKYCHRNTVSINKTRSKFNSNFYKLEKFL